MEFQWISGAFQGVSVAFQRSIEAHSRAFLGFYKKNSVACQGCHERFMGFQGHSVVFKGILGALHRLPKGFRGVPEGFDGVSEALQGCSKGVSGTLQDSRLSMSFQGSLGDIERF